MAQSFLERAKLFMMRFTFLLLVLSFAFFGCRKGKTLPNVIYVHYEGAGITHLYPQGAFEPFDPYSFNEPLRYPDYIYQSDTDDLANSFNEYLIKLLEKNNVILTTEPAEYSLHINTLSVGESLNRQSYVDTCSSSWNTEPSYVYYSELDAEVRFTLKKNGIFIDEWTRHATSSENVREATEPCSEPKVRSIWRKPESLVSRLSREARIKVANKIYDLETD